MAGDMHITCSDCGQEFTFSAADQTFFQERGYSTPKRCKPCRMAKKNDPGGIQLHRSGSLPQGTPVICSELRSSQQPSHLSPAAIVRCIAEIAIRHAKAVVAAGAEDATARRNQAGAAAAFRRSDRISSYWYGKATQGRTSGPAFPRHSVTACCMSFSIRIGGTLQIPSPHLQNHS